MLVLYLYTQDYNLSKIMQYVIICSVYEMNKHCKRNCKLLCKQCLFLIKSKILTTTKWKSKHKYPCQSWESSQGPLAPQSIVLSLDHRVKWKYRLLSNYILNGFNAMVWNVNKQSRICRSHICTKINIFCNILTFKNNYIWQFAYLPE